MEVLFTGKKGTWEMSNTTESSGTRQSLREELPILTEAERQKLLVEWNNTRRSYPNDLCVPQLVERQAIVTPDATALVVDHQKLSYQELNQRANQLAHILRERGVGPDVLVGLCLERSLDLVVGMLGILKAGGAYVPLDVNYPQDRLSFMVEDAGITILITRQQIAIDLQIQGVQTLLLDSDAPMLSRQAITDLPPLASVNDLVYVIYTSGSTGQPKGVLITHNSLLNLIFWHQTAFAVTSTDRATQVTSPAFDATGWELWPYLTIGASVYMPDEETRISPALLRDWLEKHGITITFLPTALAESIMALKWSPDTSLRLLLTGADILHNYPPIDLPFALFNNYGPTEATVVATFGHIPAIEHPVDLPPIGRPIVNTEVYILDDHLQLVPIGSAGELYIGGVGLAKGYLNRPDLTAERFIPHPFSNNPEARLYKTGDIARYLPDGQIAFMGRADHQIKIRGYRIEPDEIVSILNSHPAVQMSVVTACEETPGDKYLVAYIVPVPGAPLTVHSLRDTLAEHLPQYMAPSTFVLLDMLPLTPNGKLDRTLLPAPDVTNTLRDEIQTVPSTAMERRLVDIIAPLLNLEQISVDDNFFLLGAHSLLATQVLAKVSEIFSVNLSLRMLFEAPTVRQLAARIEELVLVRLKTMSEDEVMRLLQ
jgi:amino acid adenylation domain-containing protein